MRVPRHPPHHLLLWSAPAILFHLRSHTFVNCCFNSWVFHDRSRAIAAAFLLQQPLESQKAAYGLNGLKWTGVHTYPWSACSMDHSRFQESRPRSRPTGQALILAMTKFQWCARWLSPTRTIPERVAGHQRPIAV